MIYVWVGVAGAGGALLRYYLGLAVGFWWLGLFPLSTFIANMSGSFVLGWFTAYILKFKKFSPRLLTAFGTGLIGSFTTFSTFSVETVHLLEKSHWGAALGYVGLSLFGGLAMSASGFNIGKWLDRKRRMVTL